MGWRAERGRGHHFVFVGRMQEAEIGGDLLVESRPISPDMPSSGAKRMSRFRRGRRERRRNALDDSRRRLPREEGEDFHRAAQSLDQLRFRQAIASVVATLTNTSGFPSSIRRCGV